MLSNNSAGNKWQGGSSWPTVRWLQFGEAPEWSHSPTVERQEEWLAFSLAHQLGSSGAKRRLEVCADRLGEMDMSEVCQRRRRRRLWRALRAKPDRSIWMRSKI